MKTTNTKLKCPACGRFFLIDAAASTMPFCSDPCRLVDLGRWMNEEIGLPHHASDEDDEEIEPIPIVREWKFD